MKFTITGTNDAPVLSDTTDPSAVVELGNASAQDLSAIAGSFAVSDLDVGDTLTASIVGSPTVLLNGSAYTLPGGAAALTAAGAFTLTGATSNGGSTSIGYTYDPSAANLDFLRAGQSLTITYVVKVNDGTVDSGTQDVKFTITGTNDAPVLAAIGATTPVAEATSASAQDLAPISGTLSVSDLDVGDTLTASIAGTPTLVWSGGTLAGTQLTNLTAALVSGKLAFGAAVPSDGGSKSIGYTYDATAANLDFLRAGQTLTVTYGVKVNDGTTDSATQNLSFTITGTNDAPVLDAAKTPVLAGVNTSAVAPTGAVGALVSALVDPTTPAGGLDNVTDADSGSLLGIALTATSGTGTWYYSLNNGGAWTAVGAVAGASSLLLAADANTRLYYQSTTGGTVTNAITFRAWDQTNGTAGTKVDTTTAGTNGGTTAFSTATDTANITVTATDTTPPSVTSAVASPTIGSGTVTSSVISITFSEVVQHSSLSLTPGSGYISTAKGVLTNLRAVDSSGNVIGTGAGDSQYYKVDFTRTGSGTTKLDITSGYQDLAGNSGGSYTSGNLPAGTAGEPINLALADPASHVGTVIVDISGMPSGWSVNGGVDNGNGSWTAQTSDPSTLTVTTPAAFVGALVLNVMMSWTNADGSTGRAQVATNVEAYAAGNPIFAVSADDTLTASSAADLLVFAQPIAHDTVHNFDTTADRIDLIGFAGVAKFADLAIADDASGNAVITLANGATITLIGVHAANLSAANFEFNLEPTTTNAGTMTISNGAILPLGGIVDNTGTIALESTGSETNLEVLVESLTLRGGGRVVLSDNDHNVIFGGAASATLVNVDNTISGAGQIGAGQMKLVNGGKIVADGAHALVIDTGTNVVVNTGTLEASGSGGLVVAGALDSSGSLWANGGAIDVRGEVGGHGSATIDGSGTLVFGGAADTDVGFAAGAAGGLTLAHGAGFGGTIAGLNADDVVHLGDIAYSAATQVAYQASATGTSGRLTVSDGTHTAELTLIGRYAADAFQLGADANGQARVVNTATDPATVLGTSGADALIGTAGDDILIGSQGSDMMTGGAGSDTFMFRSSDGDWVDTITDFDAGAGGDVLALGALLRGYTQGSDLSPYLALREEGGGTIVSIDFDGAGTGHSFHDLLVLQGLTGLDFATLVAHVDTHPLGG